MGKFVSANEAQAQWWIVTRILQHYESALLDVSFRGDRRTRYSCSEFFDTLTREVYIPVAMGELIRGLGIRKMMEHCLLHSELPIE